MVEIEVSRGMPAVREVVFAEAARLEVMADWLPHQDDAGADAGDQVRADAPALRMEWGSSGTDGAAGWLAVEDRFAGASEVTVHLSLPAGEGADGADGADVRARLEESLARLHDSVLQRVNDAS